MAVFALRTAAGTSVLRGTDTLRERSYGSGWHLYLDGIDVINSAELNSLDIADTGANAVGRMQARYLDPTGTATIPATALVEFVNETGRDVYWAGRLISRSIEPAYAAAGRNVNLDAVDFSNGLDSVLILDDTIPDGWDDRRAVQYLVGKYGLQVGLTAPDSTVELTSFAIYDTYFVGKTLREALETVAAAAGDDRAFFVDRYGHVVYGRLASDAAPYAISDAPNGTTSIAANDISYEADTSQIVNAVWIASAPEDAIYGAWITDDTSIATYGRREAFYVNENVVDAATAEQYGRPYLAERKDPAIRGSFTVTGKDGWRAGQTVTITSAALGLSGATYLVTQVDTSFLTGTGTRAYRVSFGALPKSLVRLLAAS